MIIDGVNLSTIGVVVGDRSPSRSAAATAQIVESSPGAWRRVRLGRNAPDALLINVVGSVVGDIETGGTAAQLRANLDQFKFIIRPDYEMAVRWSDQVVDTPIREWLGYRSLLIVNDIVPGWETEGVKFQLEIICPDPFGRESTLQDEQSSGAAPIVLTPSVGTAPMPDVITVQGNATNLVNPVIEYRDKANTVITSISYAGTLTASDTLVIDTEHFTAKVNGSNVGGSISGSYFDVNPGDGDYLGSPAGPDVRLTADSGNATLFKVEYKRRYW